MCVKRKACDIAYLLKKWAQDSPHFRAHRLGWTSIISMPTAIIFSCARGISRATGTINWLAPIGYCPPAAAARAGGLYTDTEFDLSPLSRLRPRAVELGRSCVHPAWRSGSVIMALWTALAQYMAAHQLETMIGCASVGLNDGGQTASKLWGQLRTTHLVAPQWQVRPHVPLWVAPSQPTSNTLTHINMPSLIKGYLRCGARLLGPPALDAAFNTADLPMMLQVSELTPRYRKHFLGA